jgi:hypothetical protein
MERLLFWVLFVVSVVLAAWLPVTSAYPQLEMQIVQWRAHARL